MEAPKKSRLNSFKKNFLLLFITTLLLTYLGILTRWVRSSFEVTITDLLLPCFLGLLTSLFFSIIFYRFFKRHQFAGLIGALGMALLTGQEYVYRLDSAMPFLLATNPFSLYEGNRDVFYNIEFFLLLIGLMFLVAYLVKKVFDRTKLNPGRAARTLAVVVVVAFLVQSFTFMKIVIRSWPQYFEKPETSHTTMQPGSKKPDIYYIVLDRYTNQNVLQEQFGFDNSEFITYLKSNGFYVDPQAHSNYPNTTMSVSSTLNMQYHTDLLKKYSKAHYETDEPFHKAIRYGKVIQDLKSIGYKYYLIGSWYETTNNGPLADKTYLAEVQLTLFGKTWNLNTFPRTFLGVFQRGLRIGKHKILSYTPVNNLETSYSLGVLDQLANEKPGGRFIFAHILTPHDPYVYNADGSLSTNIADDNNGMPIKKKYTGQVQYINNQMEYIISRIKAKSNNQAVIVLLSDEGPNSIALSRQVFDYASWSKILQYSDMSKWSHDELDMKMGNLAAYYIPDANYATVQQSASSVNAFRLVFNTYFGTKLEYLPNCQYAFAGGKRRPFDFVDVTKELNGTTSAFCKNQGNVR